MSHSMVELKAQLADIQYKIRKQRVADFEQEQARLESGMQHLSQKLGDGCRLLHNENCDQSCVIDEYKRIIAIQQEMIQKLIDASTVTHDKISRVAQTCGL